MNIANIKVDMIKSIFFLMLLKNLESQICIQQ
jgi:hypothetical protein